MRWQSTHHARETAHSLISFCFEFQRAVKKKKRRRSRLHKPANSLSMPLSIYLVRRRKNPSLSLLLLLAVFNSGGFLIDRYWLSGRQHARQKERQGGREGGRLRKKEVNDIGRTRMGLKQNSRGERQTNNDRERNRKSEEREKEREPQEGSTSIWGAAEQQCYFADHTHKNPHIMTSKLTL